MVIGGQIEAELSEMDTEDRVEFLRHGPDEPGLNKLARSAYNLLGLQTYFTAGEKEVRAWTIPIGATAPQAAGVIHTDFEKGFIRPGLQPRRPANPQDRSGPESRRTSTSRGQRIHCSRR